MLIMVALKQPTPITAFLSLTQLPKSDVIHITDDNWYET
jgi:hypothetical protein